MRILNTAASIVLLLAMPGHQALAAEKIMMTPDAREMAPPALLGIWKVDPAMSAKPKTAVTAELRSFQYTKEGKLLVNFVTIYADGKQFMGNWEVQLDGTPGYEYRSDNGSTPIAKIILGKTDEHNLELTNSVAGVEQSRTTYKISDDGLTMTMTRIPKTGPSLVSVYKRWDGR